MLPGFLIEESTIRESGESRLLEIAPQERGDMLLTFAITHAVERESVYLEVFGSPDGEIWPARPLASFSLKFYCGEYQLALSQCDARFLKARWRVSRWSRNGERPFFRVYVQISSARRGTSGFLAAGAA